MIALTIDIPCFKYISIKLGIISVSVSLSKITPLLCNSFLSCIKFSIIPLCTTTTFPSFDLCGCAFLFSTAPCVAHLECPIAVDPSYSLKLSFSPTSFILPLSFANSIPSFEITAIPTES